MARRPSRFVVAALGATLLVGAWAPAAAAQSERQWSDQQLAACESDQGMGASRDVPPGDCERLLNVLSEAGYSFDDIEGQVLPHVREQCGPFGDELSDGDWECVDEAVEGPSITDLLVGMAAGAVPGGGLANRVVGGGEHMVTGATQGMFAGLYEWVAEGTGWVVEQLVTMITEAAHPDVTSDWFGEHFTSMAAIAAMVMLPLLLLHTITSVVRGDVAGLVKGYLVYVPAAAIGTAVAVPLMGQALAIVDSLTGVFLDTLGADMEAFTQAMLTDLAPGGQFANQVATSAMVLLAAAVLFGAGAVWVVLVLRDVGIFIALFFLPLGFAALVWPTTRVWFGRLVKLLATLVLSKFFIVGVLSLGAAALGSWSDPTDGGASTIVGGAGLLGVAALAPVLLLQIADVVGDQLGPSVEGATTGRTSPVSTATATRSMTPTRINQMMNDRRDAARLASVGGASPRSYLGDGPVGGGGGGTGGGEAGSGGDGPGPSGASGGRQPPPTTGRGNGRGPSWHGTAAQGGGEQGPRPEAPRQPVSAAGTGGAPPRPGRPAAPRSASPPKPPALMDRPPPPEPPPSSDRE